MVNRIYVRGSWQWDTANMDASVFKYKITVARPPGRFHGMRLPMNMIAV